MGSKRKERIDRTLRSAAVPHVLFRSPRQDEEALQSAIFRWAYSGMIHIRDNQNHEDG